MKGILVLPVMLFIVVIAVISCKKEYSYEGAAGYLRDSFNNCNPIEASGYYRKGVSLASDSFFITVDVNVTKTGAYNINTDLINGFQFTSSGNFQQTGIQKVMLKAKGMPLQDTLSVFNCSFDTSICTFSIRVKTDSIVPPVIVAASDTSITNNIAEPNYWYFTDITDRSYYSGILNESTNLSTITPTINYLNIVGWPGTRSNSNHEIVFSIQLFLPGSQIETGTYPINSANGDNFFGYANNTYLPNTPIQSFFYFYRSTITGNKDFTFNIISYDTAQHVVLGSFEGSSQHRREFADHVGSTHYIKGVFHFKLK